MRTSLLTQRYWMDKAVSWAQARLSPPQADEFEQVVEDLLASSCEDVAALRAENERLKAALKERK